jgi:hypothetical protein
MKLIEMFEPGLLLEANVLNPEYVESWCQWFARQVADPRGQQWFGKKLRAYVLNTPSLLKPVTAPPTGNPLDLPDWAQRALERGDLYNFHPAGHREANDLAGELTHIVDWFNALADVAGRNATTSVEIEDRRLAEKHLSKLMRYEPDQITKVANDWYAHMGSRLAITKTGVEVIHRWPDGHHLVTYTDFDTYSSDGNDLQNCMRGGNYWNSIQSGAMQVYALRKPNNEAVVAIRITGRLLSEVKGKQNEPPVAGYLPYVKDALNLIGLPPDQGGSQDIAKIDLMATAEGHYGTLREVSKPGLTFEDGSEFRLLTTPDNKQQILFFATPEETASTFSFRETGNSLTLDTGTDLGSHLPKVKVLLRKTGKALESTGLAKSNVYINRGEMGMPGEVGDPVMDFPNGDRVVSLSGDHKLPHDATQREQGEEMFFASRKSRTKTPSTTLFLIDHRIAKGTPGLRLTLEGNRLTGIRSVYQPDSFPRDTLVSLIETQGYEVAAGTAFWSHGLVTLDGRVVSPEDGEILESNAIAAMRRYDNLLAISAGDRSAHLLFTLKGDRVTDVSGYTQGGKACDFMKTSGLEVFRKLRLKLAPSVAKWLVERFDTYAYEGQYGGTPAVGQRVLETQGGDWYQCDDLTYRLLRQSDIVFTANIQIPNKEDYYPEDVFRSSWSGGRVEGTTSAAVRDLFNHLHVPPLPQAQTEAVGVYGLAGGQWGTARQAGRSVETRSGLTASIIEKTREITLYDGDRELMALRWDQDPIRDRDHHPQGGPIAHNLYGRTTAADITTGELRRIGDALTDITHAVDGLVLIPYGETFWDMGISGTRSGHATFLDRLGQRESGHLRDPKKLHRLLDIWQPPADLMIQQAGLEKLGEVERPNTWNGERSGKLSLTLDWAVMLMEGRLGEAQDAVAEIFRGRIRTLGKSIGQMAAEGIKTFKVPNYGDDAEQFRDIIKYLGMTKEFKALIGDAKIRKG